MIMSHPRDRQTCDHTSFQQETHRVSGNIGYVMRQERSLSIIRIVFDSWEACRSSGRWLTVQTRVYLSPLRECKGLFLTAVQSIHAALPGVSRTWPLYVWFTCMRCRILAAWHLQLSTCHHLSTTVQSDEKVYYSCGQITVDPVILEAGRKFSFEIKKHANPIIGWNYLSTFSCC